MPKKRNYYTEIKESKTAIAAIENKLTQAQLTSEYGVHATQIKTWKQKTLKAISDAFTGARSKEIKEQEEWLPNYIKKLVNAKHSCHI